MPNIREYTQQTSPSGSIDGRQVTGADFGARVGAETQAVGAGISKLGAIINERVSQLEVTDAYTLLAKSQADWTLHLNDLAMKTDPGNENFAADFNQSFKNYLDKAGEKFQTVAGQQTFNRGAAELSAHFVLASGNEQAKLAGIKATQDYTSLIDSSQIVLNNDPMQFDAILASVIAALKDPKSTYSRIPAEKRNEILRKTQEQLAASAMEGIIREAPSLGQKMLGENSGPVKYLTGEIKDSLEGKARAGIERIETAKSREWLLKERAAKDKNEEISTGLIQRILSPTKENGGLPSDKEIAMSGLDAEHMRAVDGFKFSHAAELGSQAEDRKHPAVVRDLLTQMIADGDDPKKTYNLSAVRRAYITGKISAAEETFLENRFTQLKDNSTNSFERDANSMMNTVEKFVQNSIYYTMQPTLAIEALGRIQADFYGKVDVLRKDNKDPRVLLDPQSKDYFFSASNISTYLKHPPKAPAASAAPSEPVISTDEEFNALKSGTIFVGPDGTRRVKP